MQLKYTAVIIAKNEATYLTDTIKSIKQQSIPPYRLVVIDDYSNDDTAEIARSHGCDVYMPPYDPYAPYTKYFEHINMVRNVGFLHIKEDPVQYIYCSDAECVIDPSFVYNMIQNMQRHNAVFGTGGALPETLGGEAAMLLDRDWFYHMGGHVSAEWGGIVHDVIAQGKVYICMLNTITLNRRDSQRTTRDFYNYGRAYAYGRISPVLWVPPAILGTLLGYNNIFSIIRGYLAMYRSEKVDAGITNSLFREMKRHEYRILKLRYKRKKNRTKLQLFDAYTKLYLSVASLFVRCKPITFEYVKRGVIAIGAGR